MHNPLPVAPVQNIMQRPLHTGEGKEDCNQYAQMADTSSFGGVVFPGLICSEGLGRTGEGLLDTKLLGGKRRLKKAEQGWGMKRLGIGIFKHTVLRAYLVRQIGCFLSNT